MSGMGQHSSASCCWPRCGRSRPTSSTRRLSLARLYWMFAAARKPEGVPLAIGNPWWPDRPTLETFAQLFTDPQFAGWAANTAIVTGSTLVIGVLASLLAGYALAYLDVPYS